MKAATGMQAATAADASSGGGRYDVVIVGASLAGCSTAILLGREGLRVALVDQRTEEDAFKRICSHYIQGSAVPTLERLGLLEPMMAAGALRSRARLRVPWGWIEPARAAAPTGVNLRRRILDPLVREAAARTPGVELMLGLRADDLLRERRGDSDEVAGVLVKRRDGTTSTLAARLVVGADGRGSRVARLAGARKHTAAHGRFAYGGYFEGPPPERAPDACLWLLDPDMAAAFPTDSGLTLYACMPANERLPEFRGDPEAGLRRLFASVPDPPPIADSRATEPFLGKLDMTNVWHEPTAPGLALAGDAALAADPLWGVGCGWALQSGEWLADAVAPALAGDEPLARALERYRRRHRAAVGGHMHAMNAYAVPRPFDRGERFVFSAAARDEGVARVVEAFGARMITPGQMLARALPRAAVVHGRRRLARVVRGAAVPSLAGS